MKRAARPTVPPPVVPPTTPLPPEHQARFAEWTAVLFQAVQSVPQSSHPRQVLAEQVAVVTHGHFQLRLSHGLAQFAVLVTAPHTVAVQWAQIPLGVLAWEAAHDTSATRQLAQRLADFCGRLLYLTDCARFVEEHWPPDTAQVLSALTKLTPTEHALLAALTTGATPRQIARQLSVEVSTVRTHQSRIYSKLDVDTAQAAAAIGMLARMLAGEVGA